MSDSPKVVAILQARLGSTRLPGKVLSDICGKPMLWHAMRRVKAAQLVDKVILATADNEKNVPVVEFAKGAGLDCYAGSEIDLLDRFYQPCKAENADIVVRVTADCPLVDPVMLDEAIEEFLSRGDDIDYLYNNLSSKLPDGMDIEVFSMKVLESLWENVTGEFEREWFTTIFRDNNTEWKVGGMEYSKDYRDTRLTVDYPEDLELVRRIFEALDNDDRIFSMNDMLEFLESNPQVNAINDEHKYMCDAIAIEEAKKQAGE